MITVKLIIEQDSNGNVNLRMQPDSGFCTEAEVETFKEICKLLDSKFVEIPGKPIRVTRIGTG